MAIAWCSGVGVAMLTASTCPNSSRKSATGRQPVSTGDAFAGRRIRIDDRDQLRGLGTGIFLGMETSQIPHTNDRSSHF